MPIRRFFIILLLSFSVIMPAWGAKVSEMVPAPEVELMQPDPASIQREIDHLTRRIEYERPTDYQDVRQWIVNAGNNIGAMGDYVTASWAAAGQSLPKALDNALEKFGIVFAISSCLEKQLVSGEPAGMDAAYETAKFLTGKIAGGGYAAAIGILKYSLDQFGNYATAQIDSDFYGSYVDYHLREHPDFQFYFDLYALPGGGIKVEEALDRFWDDPQSAGIRGFDYLVTTAYKGDFENLKFAYRQKFLKEYVYKAMVEIWKDKLLDAEIDLEEECQKLYLGNKHPEVRIGVKTIIDQGTAKGARNVKATLTHSGKYIVDQKMVNGAGVGFVVNAARLVDPDTLKPVSSVQVVLEPAEGAKLLGGPKTVNINLEGDTPRIEKSAESGVHTVVLTRPVFVQLQYPIAVSISGNSDITQVSARIVPGKPGYHASSTPWSRLASKKDGVFLFEDMPTGKCTFTYGNRRVTRMITHQEKIVLDAPAAVNLEAKTAMVTKPDLEALNAERIRSLQQQKNFDRFEADVKNAIAQVAVKMTEAYTEYESRYQAAMTTVREQRQLLRKNKNMPYEQKEVLQQELDQTQKSLNDEHNLTGKAFSTLNSQYSKAQREISKEIQQEDRSLNDERQELRNEMAAELKKVRELEKKINDAVHEAASELNYSGSAYKTPAEGEALVTQLEQKIAGIDDMVQQIQASVEKSNDLRQRFEQRWSDLEKRRISRERTALSLPRIMADVDQMKLLLESLKRNAIAEKSKKASESIKKRHEQRKRNAAEFAKLQDEIKTRGAELPEVAVKEFESIYRQAVEEFGAILDDPQRSEKDVKKVLAQVVGFLNHNESVIGDLRTAESNLENSYVKMDMLIKKANDMITGGMVYAGPDYYKIWQPFQSKLVDAWTVRNSTGRDLVALEGDLNKASADLEGYRGQVAAASAEVQRLLGAAGGGEDDKAADVGGIMDLLSEAWAQTELLPVFKRHSLRPQISAAADDLAAGGAIVKYARAAGRPLVIFDSYTEGNDYSNEKQLNAAIFRTRPGPEPYTSINFKAHVIGLPPGRPSLIAVEYDWGRYVCSKDPKTGKHFVNVSLGNGSNPRIRILGTGNDNQPIEYPFFKQVALN